ncbi:hypothetical protein AAMO2058_000125700 [Amorphochlora amoebiformis]
MTAKNLAAIALIALGALGQDITCKKFKDIYDNGTDLCETMWDGAFKVVDNYSAAYTMWFFDAINPNDAISQTLHPTGNTSVCNLDFYHKDFPTPEGENFTECHPWKQASCCTTDIADADGLNVAYGPGYQWDRCGTLSKACERFFVQEACFYECSPHAGLYRKWGGHACDDNDPGCSTTYNATCDEYSSSYIEGACQNQHNTWQMHQMPIRKDYCDSWFIACANDFFCAESGGSYFGCARTTPYPTPAPAKDDNSALTTELTATVAIVATFSAALLIFLGVCYYKAKTGNPLFYKPIEGKDHKQQGARFVSSGSVDNVAGAKA